MTDDVNVEEIVFQATKTVLDSGDSVPPRCIPASPAKKLIALADQAGGLWNPKREWRQYKKCSHRDPYCKKCWTQEREHREEFALGLCECIPTPVEAPTLPHTATAYGDVNSYGGPPIAGRRRAKAPEGAEPAPA